jgi:hypothetical protein
MVKINEISPNFFIISFYVNKIFYFYKQIVGNYINLLIFSSKPLISFHFGE